MIYFDVDKKAYAYEIENPVCVIEDSLWAEYAGTDKWDIVEGVFTDIADTEEYKASKTSKKLNTTNRSNSNKNYKVKTRHHNINQTFEKYTAEGLEELLKENQAAKQVKRDAEENKVREEDVPVEITYDLINKCINSVSYFNSLDEATKAAVKENVRIKGGGFIPMHLQ